MHKVSATVTTAEPIRVMHVIDKLGVGGSSVHGITQLLAQSMPMFDPGQFEFTVCSLRPPEPAGEVLKKAGVRLEYLSRSKFDPRTLSDLLALVKRKSPRILHLHGFGATSFGRLVSLITGIPNIVHEHLVFFRQPFYLTLADTLLSPLTTKALAVSKPVREYMVKSRKIAPDKLETFFCGVPLAQFKTPSARRIKRERVALGIAPDEKIVCTVGRLDTQKGQILLLRAAPLVLSKMARTRFLIVGDGPDLAMLESEARQLGIAQRVIFTGYRSDVATLIGMSDVFAIPSLYEGGPITLLEAMNMRKPVVGTPVGLMGEVIRDQKSGFLVPVGDSRSLAEKILILLQDPKLASMMGEKGWELVQRHDMSDYVRRLESIYRSLC
jgi:glycosyltransferase involved in cell wall biosynthesis